eukprot:scaffold165747_cov27-Tisochrysis_lutea.AAC.4
MASRTPTAARRAWATEEVAFHVGQNTVDGIRLHLPHSLACTVPSPADLNQAPSPCLTVCSSVSKTCLASMHRRAAPAE